VIEGAYEGFPAWFFTRVDDGDDAEFYAPARMVTHIDDGAIAAVAELYRELAIDGSAPGPVRVLDLMGSWISHFAEPPAWLTVLGMNPLELGNNRAAAEVVVHDLNLDPGLPFPSASFDAAVCCVSVDYLTHPIEVFDEVARVLAPGGRFVCTFSNRCFPTKAVAGWLSTDDEAHVLIVSEYFRRSGGWVDVWAQERPTSGADPLFAVWASRPAA